LLAWVNQDGLSSLAELDQALRRGQLDLAAANGRSWGGSKGPGAGPGGALPGSSPWGGPILILEDLGQVCGPTLVVPDDPVLATARLDKFAVSHRKREGG